MKLNETSNFKGTALSEQTLRSQAPSIFAAGPMQGVSSHYTFVPTARIVDGLREQDWVPVDVEEQRIRKEARRGYQKHLIRFRRAEQMQTLDEWNVELVLLNSHVRPPNIVLYLSDDHGVDFVGCYGNSAVHTPNIDALSREGVKFNFMFAPSPTCSPLRLDVHGPVAAMQRSMN